MAPAAVRDRPSDRPRAAFQPSSLETPTIRTALPGPAPWTPALLSGGAPMNWKGFRRRPAMDLGKQKHLPIRCRAAGN